MEKMELRNTGNNKENTTREDDVLIRNNLPRGKDQIYFAALQSKKNVRFVNPRRFAEGRKLLSLSRLCYA